MGNAKQYTDDDLTSFGNYLLSKERAESTHELNQDKVTDADFRNWKFDKDLLGEFNNMLNNDEHE